MSREFKAHKPQSSENIVSEKTVPVKSEVSETGETGGPTGDVDPVQFGDWSVNGRCVDF